MKNETKAARYEKLQEYVEGPFFMAHEFPLDDPKFDERVGQLHSLVHELEAAAAAPAAGKGDNREIVLKLNDDLVDGPCALCSDDYSPSGFDFFIEGTEQLVCMKCARTRAPEWLLSFHDNGEEWLRNYTEKSWHDGLAAGEDSAARTIIKAIDEPLDEKIKRICQAKLREDVPF